jgi:hypothetical protein
MVTNTVSARLGRPGALGFRIAADFEVPGLPLREWDASAPQIELRRASGDDMRELWSGASGPRIWWTIFEDGCDYTVWRGREGDHLVDYAGRPAFHLSRDGLVLSCAEPQPISSRWAQTLTDSVLWTVALIRGRQLLHASAVQSPQGAVAVLAAQGGGKSSLTAQLVLDGWPFVTDDILAFERRDSQIVVHPGPNLMNLSVALEPALPAEALGDTLATFQSNGSTERWLLIRGCASTELPLRATVLLRRGAYAQTELSRITATSVDVIGHTLAFRRIEGAQQRRFEAVSDLAERVPVYCLQASAETPPEELAAILRAGMLGEA